MGLGAPEEVCKQTCDWGTNHDTYIEKINKNNNNGKTNIYKNFFYKDLHVYEDKTFTAKHQQRMHTGDDVKRHCVTICTPRWCFAVLQNIYIQNIINLKKRTRGASYSLFN